MTERWQEYFEKECGKHSTILELAVEHWIWYNPLYSYIKAHTPPGGRVLDIGCGLGLSDIYLQSCGYQATGLDNDGKIVDRAAENARAFQTPCRFAVGDAFDLSPHYGQFDVVYSVGVVEHFDRDATVRLIAEQAKCAPVVVTVIPTKYIRYSAGLTDERIYSMNGLHGLVRDAGLSIVNGFGFGDVLSPLHNWVRWSLPRAAYRLLQSRFGYAMAIGCIGRAK